MSLTDWAYRRRKRRGIEVLPNLLGYKRIKAEEYISSADYHPIESFADLLRISLLTSENIQCFHLELKDEEYEHLRYELCEIEEMLRDASNRLDRPSSDIEGSTQDWGRS